MRLEGDFRALEKNHLAVAIVVRGGAIVGVVETPEIGGDADRVTAGLDVLEHARIPDTLLPFAVGSVVIEVAKLADQRALADSRAANDRHAHLTRSVSLPAERLIGRHAPLDLHEGAGARQ